MYHQITVIGPIGSGKTTASQFLSKALDLPLLDTDLFETNPFLPDYSQDIPRWAFTTELFFTLARIKKLKVIKDMLQKSSVIVDSGLMSLHVYTKNHLVNGTMTAAEWEFFNQIIADYQSDLPSPDIIIINLTCSPVVQMERIKARGRSFESGYTLDYLRSITDRLSEYAESLANVPETKLLTFDSEKHDITKPSGQKELLHLLRSLDPQQI